MLSIENIPGGKLSADEYVVPLQQYTLQRIILRALATNKSLPVVNKKSLQAPL